MQRHLPADVHSWRSWRTIRMKTVQSLSRRCCRSILGGRRGYRVKKKLRVHQYDKMMNIVYIDAQNVHKSLEFYHDWLIDWERFFVYLKEKYKAEKVKIFFGYVPRYKRFYELLSTFWYEVCFKETLILPDGKIKWNVDIDIAIFSVRDYYEWNIIHVFLVTGDGDYNSLVDFFHEKWILTHVLVPWVKNSSVLLRRSAGKYLVDIAPMRNKLQKKR